MKGLLKNNFIGVIENLKLLFPLAIIFGIIVSITGNASLLSIYSLSITPILLLLVLINVFIGGNVSDTTYYINLIVIAIITCFTFVCSYFLSAFIFRAKEF